MLHYPLGRTVAAEGEMRYALCIFRDRISPRLDQSRQVKIFEGPSKGRPVPRTDLVWSRESIQDRIQTLKAHGVDCLICGAAEPWAEEKIRAHGLEAVTWVRGTIESILQDLSTGGLEAVRVRARAGRRPVQADLTPSLD